MTTTGAKLTEERADEIAREVFLYAYPLVLMDVTRRQMTNVVEPGSTGFAPHNRFSHATELPDARFRAVIRPNLDTLYSTAWLDLEPEPIVLSVPATDRYFLLPMLTAWSDVFAAPGTRTLGRAQRRELVVVGPNHRGPLPADLDVIASPTRHVWILGRTQTDGRADHANVHAIQAKFELRPLGARGRPDHQPAKGTIDPTIDMHTPPPAQVASMDPAAFYARFAALLKDERPYFYDSPLVMEMQRLGIRPGAELELAAQPPVIREALVRAMARGLAKLDGMRSLLGGGRGWSLVSRGGFYGDDHLLRAAIARHGLGMNLPEDAIYGGLANDEGGKPLDGDHEYVLRFAKGEEPPVHAFWSITVYDDDGYLCPNALDRYALGDRDPLVRGADGSLCIYLQHASPGEDRKANWLPVPKGPFNLLLRLYWPSDAVLEGKWTPPLAKRTQLSRTRTLERASFA